jgi:hypothetical protein
MTWAVALSVATVATSALQAGMQYSAARTQAQLGQRMAALRREQLAIERDTLAVQAQTEEVERQRRAQLTESSLRAATAAFGLDPDASGSIGTLLGENRRQVMADVSAIRLLGAARQRQLMLAGRAAEMEEDAFSVLSRTAWIRPAATLLGSALSVYRTWPALDPGGTVDNTQSMYRNLTAEQRARIEPRTGRAMGPV